MLQTIDHHLLTKFYKFARFLKEYLISLRILVQAAIQTIYQQVLLF